MKYHNLAIKGLPVFLVALLLFSPQLSAATFTYLTTDDGGDVDTYPSLADFVAGTNETSNNWAGGAAISSILGMAFDGSNYAGIFAPSAEILYDDKGGETPLQNLVQNDQTTTGTTGWTNVSTTFFGVASAGDGTHYVLFDDDNTANDRLFSYPNAADFHTQSNRTINTLNFDINNFGITGFAHESGSGEFYLLIDDAGGDYVVTYSSLASLQADTDPSNAGDGNGTKTFMAGGPDLANARGFAATPVPEPATYGLISGLLLTVAVYRRRLRKA